MKDRIIFHGNPWPDGHRITDFVWSGRLEPDSGIWFDFHLETEEYDAKEPKQEEREKIDERDWKLQDWKSVYTWGNHHLCTLSSTFWEEGKGFLVGTKENKLDIHKLSGREFIVDPLETYNSWDSAFQIYLLGHDSIADHQISFDRQVSPDTFSIKWKGKIAMSYLYDDQFDFSFEANISKATLDGIYLPIEISIEEADHLLSQFVQKPQHFQWVIKNDKPCFVIKKHNFAFT